MARTKSKVTERQQKYADAIVDGNTKTKAAEIAGLATPLSAERSAAVKEEIRIQREKLTDLTTIRRLDIVDGLLDSIACARMQGDSGNMIKGYVEMAKILGLAAPEVKNINLNISQQRMQQKYEALSDEDLLRLVMQREKEDAEDAEDTRSTPH